MQVHHSERVATYAGPESCVDVPRGCGEALTGECTGQPLSPVIGTVPDADAVGVCGRRNGRLRYREQPSDPAGSKTLACAEAPCAGTGRAHDRPERVCVAGPHREGEEP